MKRGIEKYNLNWIHIFNDRSKKDAYCANQVPLLLLINPEGKTIYIREVSEKDFENLTELKKY